jgi:methyltransferase (TIGR00027 family)
LRAERPDGAEIIALARALESSRPGGDRLFDDPLSLGLLSPATKLLFQLVRLPLIGTPMLRITDALAPGVRGFIVGRTRYIDDALSAALGDGNDQIVILGAGYDSRPYRIPGIESTRVFELDLPRLQVEKRRRVCRLLEKLPEHVAFVPIDFESQELAEVLPSAGFREGHPAFFICEGVTEHISAEATDRIFRYVASAATSERRIVFTYLDRRLLDGSGHFPGTRMHIAHSGFSLRSFAVDPKQLRPHLSQRGLELIDDVAGAEFAERYFEPSGRRLRANEFHRTALARVLRATASSTMRRTPRPPR